MKTPTKTIGMNMSVGLSGKYRLQVLDKSGKLVRDSGWMQNIVTNQGLNMFCSDGGTENSDYTGVVCVGIGNATPTVSDTTLQTYLASTSTSYGSRSQGFVAGPPAYWYNTRSWQFSLGAVVGNVAEIGVGPTGGTNMPVFSRALVVDGSGNPTVIPVTSDQILTVTYTLEQYIDLTDHSYSFNLSGTPYSGTYRRAYIGYVASMGNTMRSTSNGNRNTYVSNGTISDVYGGLTGSVYGPRSAGFSSYTTGTYYITYNAYFGINDANLSGGITAIMMGWNPVSSGSGSGGTWQFSVSPAIPKTNAYALRLYWNISVTQYTP